MTTAYDPDPLGPLVAALRTGDRRPAAVVADLCDRIEAVDEEIRSFLPEPGRRERVTREATALAAREPDPSTRPPLFGVPVGVKDVFHVDGYPTAAGSSVPASAITDTEAPAVRRLREAGALVLGKTQTTEFAYFDPPPTRNPNAPGHTPGGSSSGSAAAVAAGCCLLALGTQTVGSVLRPAAFCGVTGFKPSYDRIPTDGVVPLAASVDHVGTFTADVAGATRAASVLCDGWETAAPDRRPILGVVEGPYLDQASPAGRAGLSAAVDRLTGAGYEVRRVSMLDDVAAVNDRHDRLVAAEAALSHADRFADHGDLYAAETVELLERGREVGVGEVVDARVARHELRGRIDDRTGEAGVDLLLSPAAPGPAPAGIDDTGDPVMNLPWTHAGVPAVSLPAGRIGDLPLGLQCVAPFGHDESLLAWSVDVADVVGGLGDVGAA